MFPARYEYPVSHWSRKQTTSGLSGWFYQAFGSSLLGGGGVRQVRLIVKQRNSPRTFLPPLPLPHPLRLPFPSEQSQPTGTGSIGERRFIQPGQFLWSDEGSQGRQRKEEGEKTHTACCGRVSCLGVCDCLYAFNGVCTFPIYRTSQYSPTLPSVMSSVVLCFGLEEKHERDWGFLLSFSELFMNRNVCVFITFFDIFCQNRLYLPLVLNTNQQRFNWIINRELYSTSTINYV